MITPIMMRPPPTQEMILGTWREIRLWTANARTSSTHRRLDTRLGETSCSDLVRVVKARRPDTDSPAGKLSLSCHTSCHSCPGDSA